MFSDSGRTMAGPENVVGSGGRREAMELKKNRLLEAMNGNEVVGEEEIIHHLDIYFSGAIIGPMK